MPPTVPGIRPQQQHHQPEAKQHPSRVQVSATAICWNLIPTIYSLWEFTQLSFICWAAVPYPIRHLAGQRTKCDKSHKMLLWHLTQKYKVFANVSHLSKWNKPEVTFWHLWDVCGGRVWRKTTSSGLCAEEMGLGFRGILNGDGSHSQRTLKSFQPDWGQKSFKWSPSATVDLLPRGQVKVILRVSLQEGLPVICGVMLCSLNLEVKNVWTPEEKGRGTGNLLWSWVAMVIIFKYQINLVSQQAWQRGKYNHLCNSPFWLGKSIILLKEKKFHDAVPESN